MSNRKLLCFAGKEADANEEADVNEDDYADSEELDAMMLQGDSTPEVSDGDIEERYQAFGDEDDMDPEGEFLQVKWGRQGMQYPMSIQLIKQMWVQAKKKTVMFRLRLLLHKLVLV